MSELLGIDIKTLDDGVFQFCQTVLIHKVLEATGMEHCNGLKTLTKVEAHLGIDTNGSEANIDCPNFYASVIGMMLYLVSNTRTDITFALHQYAWFIHNTKSSYETAVKRICRYPQGIKDNGLVFNPSKKLVVDYYADADFAGLQGHENTQDSICSRSITILVLKFSNCPLLWVSKLQIEIALSTLHSECVAFYHSIRAFLTLEIIIKKLIDNLGIYSENLKFLSSSTFHENNI